jgi:hypothetical protein
MAKLGSGASFVALLVSGLALWRVEVTRRQLLDAQAGYQEELRAGLSAVRTRVAVEARLSGVTGVGGDAPPRHEVEPAMAPERLDRLESRLRAFEAQTETGRWADAEAAAARAEEVRIAHETAVDGRAPLEARIRALQTLRAADERTREESLVAVTLMQDPDTSPDMRADLVHALRGLQYPELKAPMIALASDPHDDTRERAVAVLGGFSDDPGVVELLRRLSRNDESDEVRREARRQLERWRVERLVTARDR